MIAQCPTPTKALVLLLEDYPVPQSRAAAALLAENHTVFLARDWQQAVEISCTGGVDLLVLNCALPRGALSELVGLLNAEERPCAIVVIARSLEELALAHETGADAVLLEPFGLSRLGKVVSHSLAAARTSRETSKRGGQ